MVRLFDLTPLKPTRFQAAHALELINQSMKALGLTPQSIKELEKMAKRIFQEGGEQRPEEVLDEFDLTPLRFSAAQCFKICQIYLDNADVLELDVDQAAAVDELQQEFANAESDMSEQEEEAQVYQRHMEELECVIVNENKRKLCRLYLIGECPFTDLCPLRHPGREELDKLYSYYAGMPCRNFDRCKIRKCLYQHPGGPIKGSIQDNYIRRVVRGGRTTICFRFLAGCCPNTAEQCDKIHSNADEAAATIRKCRASTCKNGPECRVAGCVFNHNGYPVWYIPKSRDSIWWGKGWDEELENEKKEIQFYYEGKLREAADYYEKKLQELDDWYDTKVKKMEKELRHGEDTRREVEASWGRVGDRIEHQRSSEQRGGDHQRGGGDRNERDRGGRGGDYRRQSSRDRSYERHGRGDDRGHSRGGGDHSRGDSYYGGGRDHQRDSYYEPQRSDRYGAQPRYDPYGAPPQRGGGVPPQHHGGPPQHHGGHPQHHAVHPPPQQHPPQHTTIVIPAGTMSAAPQHGMHTPMHHPPGIHTPMVQHPGGVGSHYAAAPPPQSSSHQQQHLPPQPPAGAGPPPAGGGSSRPAGSLSSHQASAISQKRDKDARVPAAEPRPKKDPPPTDYVGASESNARGESRGAATTAASKKVKKSSKDRSRSRSPKGGDAKNSRNTAVMKVRAAEGSRGEGVGIAANASAKKVAADKKRENLNLGKIDVTGGGGRSSGKRGGGGDSDEELEFVDKKKKKSKKADDEKPRGGGGGGGVVLLSAAEVKARKSQDDVGAKPPPGTKFQ